jgi:hypothetical protein
MFVRAVFGGSMLDTKNHHSQTSCLSPCLSLDSHLKTDVYRLDALRGRYLRGMR